MTETVERRFRLLEIEARVTTDDLAVLRALDELAPRAVHDEPPGVVLPFDLSRRGEEIVVTGCARGPFTERSSIIAVQSVLSEAGGRLRRAHEQATVISAITLLHDDRCVLLVGEAGGGKSTLAMALAMAGRTVMGDHLALLEGGVAAPVPSRFSIGSASLPLLAALPGGEGHAILQKPAADQTRVAIDPVDVGREWRAAAARVSAVVLLEPNFGGWSRTRPIGAMEMARLTLRRCGPPMSPDPGWVGRVLSMLSEAETVVLEVGTPASAIEALGLFLDRRLGSGGG